MDICCIAISLFTRSITAGWCNCTDRKQKLKRFHFCEFHYEMTCFVPCQYKVILILIPFIHEHAEVIYISNEAKSK